LSDHQRVAKADVLIRVRQDLELGHTYLATQRLRTLLAVDPNDVDVYALLAGVYRRTGNQVEAGRWAFLTDELSDGELAAFVRAHPSASMRLRLLRWTGDPEKLPGDAGRQRLRELIAAAEQEGASDRYHGPDATTGSRGVLLPCLFVALVILALGALGGIGLFRFVDWILH
jgi:hypothetical protein